ncbi:MAG: hypothetical protein V2A55_00780 [Candidatus Jorgensenbacteria bacterium]
MNEDKIIQKLSEHDKRFSELVTKVDFNDFKNRVFTTQDKMLTILNRLDEERVFTTAWVERIEKEMEAHRHEIAKIKDHLKIK